MFNAGSNSVKMENVIGALASCLPRRANGPIPHDDPYIAVRLFINLYLFLCASVAPPVRQHLFILLHSGVALPDHLGKDIKLTYL